MVFSSVPLYQLDPPANWNLQQQPLQLPVAGAGRGGELPQLLPAALAAQRPDVGTAAGGGSACRPISMAERARLAKIPQQKQQQPDQPLRCPRCDSTNTKFCYFNNYSLSQPRHFCKACRRYWTRGGALRNVPVGGGCRRNNKRNKSSAGSSSSKTAAASSAAADRTLSSPSTATGGGRAIPPSLPQLPPFWASMRTLADYGSPNLGLNFTGIDPTTIDAVEYQQAGSSSSINAGIEQWRLPQAQQFPFLEPPAVQPAVSGLHRFNGSGELGGSRVLPRASGSSLITQLAASAKMEDNSSQGRPGGLPYWSGGGEGCSTSSGGWFTHNHSGFNS